ncbi:MAG: hypothetical protein V2A61_07515 [Calditrichota bacterium]
MDQRFPALFTILLFALQIAVAQPIEPAVGEAFIAGPTNFYAKSISHTGKSIVRNSAGDLALVWGDYEADPLPMGTRLTWMNDSIGDFEEQFNDNTIVYEFPPFIYESQISFLQNGPNSPPLLIVHQHERSVFELAGENGGRCATFDFNRFIKSIATTQEDDILICGSTQEYLFTLTKAVRQGDWEWRVSEPIFIDSLSRNYSSLVVASNQNEQAAALWLIYHNEFPNHDCDLMLLESPDGDRWDVDHRLVLLKPSRRTLH